MKDETVIKISGLIICGILCITGLFINNEQIYLMAMGAIIGILSIPAGTTAKMYFFRKKTP